VNVGAKEIEAQCGSEQDGRMVRVLGVKFRRAQLEDSRHEAGRVAHYSRFMLRHVDSGA
jgi:hypothetical protein